MTYATVTHQPCGHVCETPHVFLSWLTPEQRRGQPEEVVGPTEECQVCYGDTSPWLSNDRALERMLVTSGII